MLTEETKIDLIEILESRQIQVREATIIYRDGEEITRSFRRWVLHPGDDVSGQPDPLPALAAVLWPTVPLPPA